MDLALNNLKWLICHETKPNQTKLGSLWPRVIAPDRFLSMGQIELFSI